MYRRDITFGLILFSVAWAQTPSNGWASIVINTGTASVGGGIGEWLPGDKVADMYRAGDAIPPPPTVIESELFMRYDPFDEVIYALVRSVNGQNIESTPPDTAFIKVSGFTPETQVDASFGNDGTPPDFAWYNLSGPGGLAEAWEASFELAPGKYVIDVHSNVFSDGESQTSALDGRALEIEVPSTPEPGSLLIWVGGLAITYGGRHRRTSWRWRERRRNHATRCSRVQ